MGLGQHKRRSHGEQGAELAPRRADATEVKTAELLPPPPARPPARRARRDRPGGRRLGARGTSPDAGRWQPGAQEWEGPRRGRRAAARVPGLSAAASGSTRPGERTGLRRRPSLDAEGRSLEASKPEERPPPSPRPPRPPRAWRTSSPLWPAPGAEGGRELWGGEGRSPRGPGSATSLARKRGDRVNWEEGERERKRAVTPLGAFCQRRRGVRNSRAEEARPPGKNSPL